METDSSNRALQWAREQMEIVDKERATNLPLYVSNHADPRAALQSVRDFALRLVGRDDKSLALVVVGLDRILDQLKDYQARTIYERKP